MTEPNHLKVPPTAWVNCGAGVAGDMLLAALIDAGADRLAVMDAWAALGLDGYTAMWERVDRCGVDALWTNIAIGDPLVDACQAPNRGDYDDSGFDRARRSDAHHSDAHRSDAHGSGAHVPGAHGEHHHRPARDVVALIADSDLPARVAANAVRVYRTLAAVEGAIHGVDADEVELHEVGALDSILDIVGVCAALDDLGIDELTYSAIGLGCGTVRAAHGELPHPAPATSRLIAAAAAPVRGIDTTLETATPTGVALLTVLGIPSTAPPAMTVSADGFGAGTANPDGRANVVHVMIGTRDPVDASAGAVSGGVEESLFEIETNVDDVTGEVVAYTIERLLEAGAADAWASAITMKKNRPAFTLHALGTPALLGELRDILLAETGSLGARVRPIRRWALPRTPMTLDIDGHRIAIKMVAGRYKVEYADAADAARATGRPLRDILRSAEEIAASQDDRPTGDR